MGHRGDSEPWQDHCQRDAVTGRAIFRSPLATGRETAARDAAAGDAAVGGVNGGTLYSNVKATAR